MSKDLGYSTQPEMINPLTQAKDIYAVKQAQATLQNQQGQNQIQQAKLAMGQIYKDSTDPVTGQLDGNKFKVRVANNPLTAILYPDAASVVESVNKLQSVFNPDTNRSENIPIQQVLAGNNPYTSPPTQQEQAAEGFDQKGHDDDLDNLDHMINASGELLKKQNLSPSDLIKTGADLVSKGFQPDQVVGHLQNALINPDGTPASSEQLQQHTQTVFDAAAAAKAQKIANGGLHSKSKYPLPQTPAEIAEEAQLEASVPQQQPSYQDNQIQQPQSKYPGNQVATPSEPQLGYSDTVKDSKARIKQVYDNATASTEAAAPFNKMIELSKKIATGPSSDSWNTLKTYLTEAGIAPEKMQDAAATYSEFQKYANRVAVVQGDGHTNPYLAAVQSSNPNDKQLPETIQNVARFALAQLQGNVAKQTVMRNSIGDNPTAEKEQQFNNDWNRLYDPRAIEFRMLPPEKKAKYLTDVGSEEAKRIGLSLRMLGKWRAFDNESTL